ncbi:hypothetical protein [Thalassospira sp. MCCC 1A01428]|uniref:hypothetical protein n=1 Tax=Thalassospira sp. MCCC 1A01428 TaxID=1470575 RepID=UPI000A1E2B04|nr:hypothetical protein [Thalassospira sp. MCCC 1A01428]OSQ34510.1 hypothetical protein THS27_25275 [Thalassospira sp. MCCC 1A01428]
MDILNLSPHLNSKKCGAVILKYILIISLILLYAYEIFLYSARSIWIDEISSLLNYPLGSIFDIFKPLPYAQQAAPASFNLLSNVSYALSIQAMRILFSFIIVSITLATITITFRGKILPCLASVTFLASISFFFQFVTELKFYGCEIAGAVVIASWVIRYNERDAFRVGDLCVLIFAIILGFSTLVIAICAALTVFYVRVSKFGWLTKKEIFIFFIFGIFCLIYYVQLKTSVTYQVESFPDSYGVVGLQALLKIAAAIVRGYGFFGCFTVGLIFLILLYYFRGNGDSRRFFMFSVTVLAVFFSLAVLGKYPATATRHIAWTAGIVAMAAGLAMSLVTKKIQGHNNRIAGGIVVAAIVANLVNSIPYLTPRNRSYTESDKLITWLEAAARSNIVPYYGGSLLVSLLKQRGAEIGQHNYFGMVNLSSGRIDPKYFSETYLSQNYNTIAKDMIGQLNRPVGWVRMAVVFRLVGNFKGYADYVLGNAPQQGPFYIVAVHVNWNSHEGAEDPRYQALLEALSDRDCTYEMELTGKMIFAMKVTCPQAKQHRG